MSACSSDSVDPHSDHQQHENSRCEEYEKLVEITRTPVGDQAMRHDEPHHVGKWHQEWKQGPEWPGFIRRQITWHKEKGT